VQETVMIIPADALPLFLNENERRTFTESNGPEPVDSSASLRGALSSTLKKRGQALEEDWAYAEENSRQSAQERNRRRKSDQLHDEKSRQDDRRKANHPVLLDTRMTRNRRQSAKNLGVNIKI
jgi:hypothetical protein